MITAPEIWGIICNRMPRDRWALLEEIYQVIEKNALLDDEDFEPQSPSSGIPKWKRNVRNVLQYRKGVNELKWNGKAGYLLE